MREIETRGITMFRTVPVLLRQLADTLGPNQRLNSVRRSYREGSASTGLISMRSNAWHLLMLTCTSELELTETAGQFSGWFVDRELRASNPNLPVGRIHPDLRVMFVDERSEPVAEGEVGKFVVSGRYISQGYWNDPELTARVFTTDAADPQSRVFKTGDWGRRREDGLIEFVGRNDQQIKLNGRRVEIGEIEAALRACAGVQDAAVLVRMDSGGMPQSLKGYVERKHEADNFTARELAASLRARLPGFMVPASLAVLGELPRLPNFKIDREELRRRDDELSAPVSSVPESLIGVNMKTAERLQVGLDSGGIFLRSDEFRNPAGPVRGHIADIRRRRPPARTRADLRACFR